MVGFINHPNLYLFRYVVPGFAGCLLNRDCGFLLCDRLTQNQRTCNATYLSLVIRLIQYERVNCDD